MTQNRNTNDARNRNSSSSNNVQKGVRREMASYSKSRSKKITAKSSQQASMPKQNITFGEFDKPFFILVLILLVIGTVMMFSASYYTGLSESGDGLFYVKKQLEISAVGLVAMLVLAQIDYHKFFKPNFVFFLFSGTLLMLAYTSFFGKAHNNARRWLKIGPIEFQPSEIMKFAIVILFAYMISVNYKRMKKFKYGVLPFFIVLGIIAGLMMIQPHLSGTILICTIGIVMIYVGGARLKHLLYTAAVGVGGLVMVVLYKAINQDFGYFATRFKSWSDPFADVSDKTWQTCQSLIAIGSGGLFGMGFGNSRQKFLYLPESKNDFVFAVVCEEMGLIGALLVIILFALFIFRGFYIASKSPDKFGMMIAVGLTAQIGVQALFNIAVVTNTIPNTGISLPFFSYGGTAIAMQLAQMGIILNISRQSLIED